MRRLADVSLGSAPGQRGAEPRSETADGAGAWPSTPPIKGKCYECAGLLYHARTPSRRSRGEAGCLR